MSNSPFTAAHQRAARIVAVKARVSGWTPDAIRVRLYRLRDHPRPTQAILIWLDRVNRGRTSYQCGLPDELRTRSGDLPSSRLKVLLGGSK